jgi:hypothetical protein
LVELEILGPLVEKLQILGCFAWKPSTLHLSNAPMAYDPEKVQKAPLEPGSKSGSESKSEFKSEAEP